MRLLTKVTFAIMGMTLVLSGPVQADEQMVYFPVGGADVKATAAIKKVAQRAAAGSAIHLSGSTDPQGSDDVNLRLRASRAESVKRALVDAGVEESRITIEESTPSTSADPKSYWKLRNVAIRYEGGAGQKVAKTEPAEENATPKQTAAEKRAAAAEERRAAAEAKRAEAEQKKAEAAEAKKTAAEQKQAAADAKKAEAEAKKAQAAEQKQAAADAKKAEAEQKRAEAEQRKNEKLAMVTPKSTTSSTTEPKPSENVAREGKKLEPMKLIYWKSLNHALWIIAKEKGFFAQEGFDVTLQETDEDARTIAKHTMESAEGVHSTDALAKGQRKFGAGAVCGFAVHESMADKKQIVDIGSMIQVPLTMVMKKELAPEIEKNIAAFKGKKIGEITYGSTEHDFKYTNIIRGELEKLGISEGKDYSIVEYSDVSKLSADLASGKLDMMIVLPPDDVEFATKHAEYSRLPLARFFPYLPCCRQVVTRDQLKNNRDKYVRMLRASIRAHEYIINHPRETAQILSSYLKMPDSVIRKSIMTSYIQLTPDPMRKGVELYQRANDKRTGTRTNTAEYVDTSLYRDALFSLSKEAEGDAGRSGYYDTMKSRFRANN